MKQELRQFVIDNFLFGRNGSRLSDTDSFLEKGIIDSTGVVELVHFIEERYGFHVEDSDLVPEFLDSIENLANYVESRTRAAAAEAPCK